MENLFVFLIISGCGYCKRFKPVFAEVATELKGQVVGNFLLKFACTLVVLNAFETTL